MQTLKIYAHQQETVKGSNSQIFEGGKDKN